MLDLLQTYKQSGEPVCVDFRELYPHLNKSNRYSHLLHHYPAKLLMHIPYAFLNTDEFSQKGDLVLDPFSGSGTTLLEGVLAGRSVVGADANPLARLITKVKVTPISSERLASSGKFFKENISAEPNGDFPDVVNIDFWFSKRVKTQLQCVLESVLKIEDKDVKDFYKVCFSSCVRKVSYADPRVSVPVKLKYQKYPSGHPLRKKMKTHLESLTDVDVLKVFDDVVARNTARLLRLNNEVGLGAMEYSLATDANNLSSSKRLNSIDSCMSPLEKESVQLVITSPPYPGAQKYVRTCSLSLGWLGVCQSRNLLDLKRQMIGREEFRKTEYELLQETGLYRADEQIQSIYVKNKQRARIASSYLLEMKIVIQEVYDYLKAGGYLVLIAANNTISGIKFHTVDYLKDIAVSTGFDVEGVLIDDIRSRGLMTKRNKSASVINREWVLVFVKRY